MSTAQQGGSPRVRGRLTATIVPVTILVVAVVVRLINLDTAYDLFIDEPFYVALGRSVSNGNLPYTAGSLFFLHPPGYSVLVAGWIHLNGGVQGSVIDQVFAVRYLNVVFAGITAVLLYFFGRRLASPAVGIIAAAIFVISPWFIRQNGMVLLETSAMSFVLAGFLLLLYLPARRRTRIMTLVVIGLLLGYGILIKELAVFVAILPIVIVGLRRTRQRQHANIPVAPPAVTGPEAGLVIISAAVPYFAWCLIVWLTGHLPEFWAQTSAGFSRAAGLTHTTGFNSAGTPSFLSTVLSEAPQFWTTYLMLAVGAMAVLWMLLSRDPDRRVLGAFGFGALPLLGYSVLFGANEEQFYYYLLIPACLAVAVCAVDIWQMPHAWARRALIVLAVVWVASDVTNWAIVRAVPDNESQQIDQWMRAHVPDGTAVGVTDSVQREYLNRYDMISDTSATALQIADAHYLVVSERLVEQGYALIGPEQLAAQVGDRRPVFSTSGRGAWNVHVYDLR